MKEKVKTLENIRDDMLKLCRNEDLNHTLIKKMKLLAIKGGIRTESSFLILLKEFIHEVLDDISNEVFIHTFAEKKGIDCTEFKIETKEKLLSLKMLIYKNNIGSMEIIRWIDNFIAEQLQPN